MGHPRAGYERQVRLRLVGVTPLRRSRIRAAASAAAANQCCQQRPYRHYRYTVGGGGAKVWHRCQSGALSSPKPRRLTAGVNTSSVSMGCVGHTSVHCDSGSCAWGSGVCARRVEQQQHEQTLPRQLLLRTVGRLELHVLVYSRGGGGASPPRTAAD